MPSPLVPPESWRRLRLEADGGPEVFVPLDPARVSLFAHGLTVEVRDTDPVSLYTGFARSEKGSIAWKRNEGDIRKLIKYWTRGEGAAKIGWGKPCDFCSCLSHLAKYIHDEHELKGFCARLHKRATGKWPGPRSKGKHCPC